MNKDFWCFRFFSSILLIDGSMLEDGSKTVKPIFDGEQDWVGTVITRRNVELKFAEKRKFLNRYETVLCRIGSTQWFIGP